MSDSSDKFWLHTVMTAGHVEIVTELEFRRLYKRIGLVYLVETWFGQQKLSENFAFCVGWDENSCFGVHDVCGICESL